ncbi:hypothetical protein JF50_11405 [Pseudoalteromonas luteoviolacea]|uniref:Uncharacterized protein n=1 Tax=Pseudoalteromonas luteoviolacea TaxID=43657 RepID=A0A0C1MHW0_9GAMM|nr:hypothetical protein [Pseudoalteromonas luteoviolacea]KID56544.1 hypothetical protein JF50_11405 [Pseudoalteromonas luteoviolacea]
MNQNLYFQTNNFDSSNELANYVHTELLKLGISASKPIDSDYMFSTELNLDGVTVDVFMGKNDEDTEIPLWQIWPEQRFPFLKKIYGNANKTAELKVKNKIERLCVISMV